MKYIANPVEVDAFVITEVRWVHGDASVHLKFDNGIFMDATPEMCARMTPKPGDYWVRQEDGYVYLNPKDVFERKYHPKPEPLVAMPAPTWNPTNPNAPMMVEEPPNLEK